MTDDLFRKVRSRKTLYAAWKRVRANGLSSQSEQTRREIREYEADVYRHINSLSSRLRNPNFRFAPARGVPLPRKGKEDRPIVVAPVDNKVVQRTILDVLQSVPGMRAYAEPETSFGGIRERSVEQAIELLVRTIKDGYSWFARSDIKSFFVNIPRSMVIEKVGRIVSDTAFMQLFERSLETELSNLSELRDKRRLFPIEEIGVAQGSSLSPFAGNVALRDFDDALNGRGIMCVRYIDDFVILARSQRDLRKAVKSSIAMLHDLGLTAYDPFSSARKGAIGGTKEPIDFLGVEIHEGAVRPSASSRQRLIEKIDDLIKRSVQSFTEPERCYNEKRALVQTLKKIDDTLQGWVTQYEFCSDERVLKRVNALVDKRLGAYLGRYAALRSQTEDALSHRKVLGVRYLETRDWKVTS